MQPSSSYITASDLALDRHRASPKKKGVIFREALFGDVHFSALTVRENAKDFGKPAGRYLSIAFPSPALWSEEEEEELLLAVQLAIRVFFKSPPRRLLIAGLGNRRLTADSLGPLVAERVNTTASLPEAIFAQFGIPIDTRVAICAPDVFSKTGIESVRTVEAASRLFDADALLAFDALATSEKERLLRVIELTDTGTVPGGGVKQGKEALTAATLGIPTVAVGVPTVVRADAEHFLVPRDLEEGISAIASLLSRAVDLAFHGDAPNADFSIQELFVSEEL